MNIVRRRSSCYTFCMGLRTLLWSAKCVGYCILGIFVCGQVTLYATRVVWWFFFHSDATHLSLPMFGFEYFFVLRGVFGFILGLVPLSTLRNGLRSVAGRFAAAKPAASDLEDDWSRPALWAWLPVALIFAALFLAWQPPDSSVIATSPVEGRFEHFFNPMAIATMNYRTLLSASSRVFELVIITGSMVFMLAYTVGVWVRYQFPSLQRTRENNSTPPAEQSIEPH